MVSLPSLDNRNLFVGQPVEFVHQRVNVPIQPFDAPRQFVPLIAYDCSRKYSSTACVPCSTTSGGGDSSGLPAK